MTDFFKSLSVEDYGALAEQMAAAAKPTNEMSAVEWAEYQVLDAAFKLERARAALTFTRVTGEPAPSQ